MRNVALVYVRRSMVRTAVDEVPVERQRDHCLSDVERRGWIPELFEDAEGHKSGRHEQGRPGWLALKSQLDRPDVAAIVVESLSRASRSVKDLSALIDELQEYGISLVSLKEQIDTNSAMGRAFIGFIAVMNQFESDIASERMAMNIAYKRANKGRHWGRTPFGCQRQGSDRELIPSTEGATVDGVWRGYHEALRMCYEWYVGGEIGIQALADRLNENGYRFRDSHGEPRLFNQQDVRRMLDSHRLYAGNVILGKSTDRRSEGWKGSHQPILPPELCEQVAKMIEERRVLGHHINANRSPVRTYLLTDILYCADCGRRLVGAYKKSKQYYRHDRSKRDCTAIGQVLAEKIDTQVMDRLAAFQAPEAMKERIRQLVRTMLEEKSGTGKEWKQGRARITAITNKLAALKDLRIEGEINKAEYYDRKAQLEAQLREAQSKLREEPVTIRNTEELLAKVDHIAQVIQAGSPETKKALMNLMFERIEHLEGKITKIVPRPWARPFFA